MSAFQGARALLVGLHHFGQLDAQWAPNYATWRDKFNLLCPKHVPNNNRHKVSYTYTHTHTLAPAPAHTHKYI